MTDKHTPEPWHVEDHYIAGSGPDSAPFIDCGHCSHKSIAEDLTNARRICAAVNATAGIPTSALEDGCIADMRELIGDAVEDQTEFETEWNKAARALLTKLESNTP